MAKPDYTLSVLDKRNGYRCNSAGAGWIQDNGRISLSLNPGVLLAYNTNFVISLFPVKDEASMKDLSQSKAKDDFEDDIPF